MAKAIVRSYGISGARSALTTCNIDAYNLDDSDTITDLNNARGEIFERAKRKNQSSYGAKPCIHYDENIFNNNVENELVKTLNTRATQKVIDQSQPQNHSKNWCKNTKYRTVTSTVTCFGDASGNKFLDENDPKIENRPFEIVLTTSCGINFMDTNSEDLADYVIKGHLQKQGSQYVFTPQGEQRYLEEMEGIFKRFLWAQAQKGVNVAILPLLGGKLYVGMLDNANKIKAKNMIHTALKNAIESLDYNGQLNSISEIIYSIPDATNQNDLIAADMIFKNFSSKSGNLTVTLTNADIFDAAHKLRNMSPQPVVGISNPGSYRTIGGAYEEWSRVKTIKNDEHINMKKMAPLEETICNLTDAVFRQSIDQPTKKTTNNYEGGPFIDFKKNKPVPALTNPLPTAPLPTPASSFAPPPTNPHASTTNPAPQSQPPQPAAAQPQQNPNSNSATIQAPHNVNLISTWAVRHMSQQNEWREFGFKEDNNNGVKTYQGKIGDTKVAISKNAISFQFKDGSQQKDVIRKALRLLIAGTYGENYKNATNVQSKVEVSFSGSENVQQILKAVCQEPEFAKYIKIAGAAPAPAPQPAQATNTSNDNNTSSPSISGPSHSS